MYTLTCMKDLRNFGIEPLTGESDAYGRRILCDVSEAGREVICSYFGLPADTKFADNWNQWVGEDKAIGCVMIDRASWMNLGIYLLMHVGKCKYVIEMPHMLQGVKEDDPRTYAHEYVESAMRNPQCRVHHNNGITSLSGRNTHQMSGRTE